MKIPVLDLGPIHDPIAAEIDALQRDIASSIDGTRITAPTFRGQLDIAAELDYAGRIPTVADVLSHVSGATQSRHTELNEIVVEYAPDQVRVQLIGTTAKGSDSDSMDRYNGFIARMRRHGYALSASDIHTGPRDIRFELLLTRQIGGTST